MLLAPLPLRHSTIDYAARDDHEAYFRFFDRVFPGADFRHWYERDGWGKGYVSHAYFAEGDLVANVSVSEMSLVVNGQGRRGWQLGGVGVLPEYRGRGLSRQLMEAVLALAHEQADVVFLFANASVLDYYPRFGFQCRHQSRFSATGSFRPEAGRLRHLDLGQVADRALLFEYCKMAVPLSQRFSAVDYYSTLLWYGYNDHTESFYYDPEVDAVIVAQVRDQTLRLLDILAKATFDLQAHVGRYVSKPIKTIEFGFSPESWWKGVLQLTDNTEGGLFVLGDACAIEAPFHFPELAHA